MKILLGNYLAMLLLSIDNAGGGGAEGAKINLFPLVKKRIFRPLKEIFPDLILEEPTGKLPARGSAFTIVSIFYG